jgi:4-amino-4-deoxy-L-arabinose transferase-like glycosyltransferase
MDRAGLRFGEGRAVSEGAGRSKTVLWRAFVFLLPVAALAPFAAKPYQADDLLTIWVAEQIAQHPLDFYGFEIDYGYARVPIHTITHNPPATAYLLALIGKLSGWNLVALHLGMSLFAAFAALGIFELARDLGARAGPAAIAGVLTPAFLVSASTLMTDSPLLAFYVWAIVAWRRGIERSSWRWLLCAAVCAASAAMMKYFGVTLIPLLLMDGAVRRPRVRLWWLWLAIPAGSFVAFQAYVYARYGTAPFFDAMGIATAERWREDENLTIRPVLTLVFLGGGLLPLIVLGAMRAGAALTGAAFVLAGTSAAPVLDGYSLLQLLIGDSERYEWDVLVHLGIFVFAGVVLLAAATRGLAGVERRDVALLAFWIAGTIAFTAFVNHYVNVRALLPLLPAVAVLVMIKESGRVVPVAAGALGAVLCAWLLVADYDVAAHDARAARTALERAKAGGVPLHYVAFWGFEYHLMKAGAEPLAFAEKKDYTDPARPLMQPGGLLIVDAYGSDAWTPPPRGFSLVEEIDEPYRAFATTFDSRARAGFYWHGIGVVPYRFGDITPERFLLIRWDGLSPE